MSDAQALAQRTRTIKRVLWIILFLNVGVAVAKYAYGALSHSASMEADGIHSLFDGVSNVVGLIGITLAARPADYDHPYGHSKYETYASVVIGMMLLFAAYNVGSTAILDLVRGTYRAQVDVGSFVVMIGTLLVNIGVTTWERRVGKRIGSEILVADANHTLSDVYVSVGVIIGLILVKVGVGIADPIMALFVTVMILRAAYQVFKQANATLADSARIPIDAIERVVLSSPGVLGAHKIRTRGSEAEVYVDLHVLVDGAISVARGHEIAKEVTATLHQSFPQIVDVVVHIEPLDDAQIETSKAEEAALSDREAQNKAGKLKKRIEER